MKRQTSIVLILTGIASLLFGFTSPNQSSLPTLLLAFSILYLFCAMIFLIIINLAYDDIKKSQGIFIAFVLAFCPVLLLALESLSTVSFIDILLAIGLPVVIVWYGVKRSS
jgi:hypothetical protein